VGIVSGDDLRAFVRKVAPGSMLLSDIDKTMKPNDLLQGALGLLILRILALELMHGWSG
jgi:hypothetical protein